MSSILWKAGHAFYRRIGAARPRRDTPFIEAHTGGFYEDVRGAFAALLHTGIQRVAKENVFSDLNNIFVCTVKDADYASYFGFTENEVKKMLVDNGMEYTADVKEMYDGYNIGGIDIYTASGQSLIHGQL